jgi:hypothetical protein
VKQRNEKEREKEKEKEEKCKIGRTISINKLEKGKKKHRKEGKKETEQQNNNVRVGNFCVIAE